eukprot:TRINITY_DN18_c0_g1_i5.p1 TRINITY_DN18_c0_g1~~TRINITY_DN18_c0_g1_i5.p1  ORF type:complete len:908 (+),score=292.21 TRINITY_DN18_c0_g1_i5:293-3016(+)
MFRPTQLAIVGLVCLVVLQSSVSVEARWSPGSIESEGDGYTPDDPNQQDAAVNTNPNPVPAPKDQEFAPKQEAGAPPVPDKKTENESAEPSAAEAAANKAIAEATGETAGTGTSEEKKESNSQPTQDASVTVDKSSNGESASAKKESDKYEDTFGCSMCTTYAALYAKEEGEKKQYASCEAFNKIEAAKRACQAFYWRHGKLLEQEKPGGLYHSCYVAGFCKLKGAQGMYLGYNYSASVLEDKPTNYLRLNDPPASKRLLDATKYHRNGAVHGGLQKLNAPGLIANDFNSAMELNSDSKYLGFVYVPDGDEFGAKDKKDGKFTVECWIRPYALPKGLHNKHMILDKLLVTNKGKSISHTGFQLYLEDGVVRFSIADYIAQDSNVYVDYPTVISGPLTLYQKYHIVASFDGAALRLYVNKAEFKKVTAVRAAAGKKWWSANKIIKPVPSPTSLRIGAATIGHQLFKGVIDEVAFYNNTALSTERVHTHYKWGHGEVPPAGKTPSVDRVLSRPARTTGGSQVTISGANFYPSMKIMIGGRECTKPGWMSPTQIACIAPPGAGKKQTIVVTAPGGKSSKPVKAFDYADPVVSRVVPDFGPGMGGSTVVIEGENFGASATKVTAKFGSRQASSCTWKGQAAIECKIPPGVDQNVKVSVTVGGAPSANWGLFNYDIKSCLYAFNTKAHRGSGDYVIDPDGKAGPKKPITARCDMTGDGGGWMLVSHYHLAEKKYAVSFGNFAGHIAANINTLESRYEVHTPKKVYKRFLKNTGVRGSDHYGNTAWAAQCKQKWSDKWSGNDWGLNKALAFTFVPLHKAASNKGSGNWRYNVMSACHRSLTCEKDGNMYTAQANTYYKSWNAYCGGLQTQTNVVRATGCSTSHTFEKYGTEGKVDHRYYSDIKDLKHIMVWIK